MSDETPERVPIATVLGHEFKDPDLIELALSHASYAHEVDGSRGNERLEFLGDAVLGVLVAQGLFESHPDWSEGDLTRALASLVDRRSLAGVGAALDLGSCLRLGRTEHRRRDFCPRVL